MTGKENPYTPGITERRRQADRDHGPHLDLPPLTPPPVLQQRPRPEGRFMTVLIVSCALMILVFAAIAWLLIW